MLNSWQATTNLIIIEERAKLLNQIRKFFQTKKVLEVETPLMCNHAATAIHIDSIVALEETEAYQTFSDRNKLKFLQTSPEYAMKRLLSQFHRDCFQICKAFRGNEIGDLHNPEFTMLEWYRIGFDHHKLMEEVGNLLIKLLSKSTNFVAKKINIKKIAYSDLFIKYINLDPMLASVDDLKDMVFNNIKLSDNFQTTLNNATKRDYQELLFNFFVEPELLKDLNTIWFIYNYPKEQAALAKTTVDENGRTVAERFEVYINGIEIANGYHELLDHKVQESRFREEQQRRMLLGKPELAIDSYFIDALRYGMPPCSGVALGIDRLLMIKVGAKVIQDVICFPHNIA